MKFSVFLSVTVLSFGYAIMMLPLVKYFTKFLEKRINKNKIWQKMKTISHKYKFIMEGKKWSYQ